MKKVLNFTAAGTLFLTHSFSVVLGEKGAGSEVWAINDKINNIIKDMKSKHVILYVDKLWNN